MSDDRTFIGEPPTTEPAPTKSLEVTLNGETFAIQYAGDQSILETLISEGYDPPYSCMEGNCMACMAKIKAGTVYQEDPGILCEDNIEEGEALTCQARPWSEKVVVDYDDL